MTISDIPYHLVSSLAACLRHALDDLGADSDDPEFAEDYAALAGWDRWLSETLGQQELEV